MAQREVITAALAPQAIGPYAVANRVGGLVFTAGQLGLLPETMELAPGGVEAETHQALSNLAHVLQAAGSGLEHVAKTTIFLRDMNDFGRVNAVYASFFSQAYPARSTVQVARLPKDAAVEIEAVAVVP